MEVLPSTTVPPGTVQDLLDLLENSGGSVQILDPPEEVRAAWRRLLHVLRSGGHVPSGWHLAQRGRDSGDFVVELRRGLHPSKRYQPAKTVRPLPQDLTGAHPVVHKLRDQPERLSASETNRSRTLILLQAIAADAVTRGYTVKHATPPALMTVSGEQSTVDIRAWETTGKRWSGRLTITVDVTGRESLSWHDYSTKPIEAQMPEILTGIRKAIGSQEARMRAERQAAVERIDREREQQITRHRAAMLRDQVARWLLAQDIRAHCADLSDAVETTQDSWIRWASEYAESIDPLSDPPGLPAHPEPGTQPGHRAPATSEAPASAFNEAPRPWHPNRRWYRR